MGGIDGVMKLKHLLVLALALVLSSCSDREDDSEIFAGEQDSKIVNSQPTELNSAVSYGTFKYFNVGDQGKMAWRIPKKGTAFGRSFTIVFSNGYRVRIPNSAKRCYLSNGFIYRPGIGTVSSGTGTSHGGMYVYAPRGNKSKTLTIVR